MKDMQFLTRQNLLLFNRKKCNVREKGKYPAPGCFSFVD